MAQDVQYTEQSPDESGTVANKTISNYVELSHKPFYSPAMPQIVIDFWTSPGAKFDC